MPDYAVPWTWNSTVSTSTSTATVTFAPVTWSTTAFNMLPHAQRAQVNHAPDGRDAVDAYMKARERALSTLLSILSEENRERLREYGYIEVVGSTGGRYRVHSGYQGNVWRYSDGQRLCAHPPMNCGPRGERLPPEDAMIAQIVTLQADEPRFLGVANLV